MFDIQENLKKLPDAPGVYIHKDKLGQVIYVGKAISLKNRVRQYFQSSKNMDAKVRAMVSHIAEFEYITCGSEMEAFILENNLIKQYRPKYNILLRDDKTYPYIKVTTGETWPRIVKTRIVAKDKDKYFGPYSDAGAVNQMIDFLNNIYRLKRCSARSFPKGFRPCLNYHIGQCDGICTGQVDRDAYMEKVGSAMDYLKGNRKKITDYLEEKMKSAAERMEYEEAGKYRDYLLAAEALSEKQRVVLKPGIDMDVVLAAGKNHVALFFVRDGKLTGRETYGLQVDETDGETEQVGAFLRQHYGEQTSGPSEILVKKLPPESRLTQEFLADLWGKKVQILAPQKGEKKALVDLAVKDTAEMVKTIADREKYKIQRHNALGEQLHKVLSQTREMGPYQGQSYRVEAYDISNTNGVDTVGAMVAFVGMRPDKKAYRRFKVRTVEGPNDYGSMQEVVYRRVKRALEGDPGFSPLPDALLIDGGKGHGAAVMQVLEAFKVDIPVLGMVKDDRHRTRGLVYRKDGEWLEHSLEETPFLFQFIGRIQEEVHRFAIDYHRGIRDKKALTSVLDEIQGVGPVKRNALLAHFGGIDKIRVATIEELEKAPGISPRLAGAIREYFAEKKN
ncbi:MAG: excinuclease ABC subunit UvrC [Anaerovoracaceae bacterium]|jgi:excinuclease ABC subunit C